MELENKYVDILVNHSLGQLVSEIPQKYIEFDFGIAGKSNLKNLRIDSTEYFYSCNSKLCKFISKQKARLNFQIQQPLKGLFELFYLQNIELFVVGGAVRDMLTSTEYLKIADFDLVTDTNLDNIVTLLEANGWSVQKVTKVRDNLIISKDDHSYELMQYVNKNLIDDAKARDFTVNAFYYNPIENILLDPLVAISDVLFKKLKFANNIEVTLTDDPTRILRFYRFISQGWKYDTAELIEVRKYFNLLLTDPKYSEAILTEIEKMSLSFS